jgi:hypothetical protein
MLARNLLLGAFGLLYFVYGKKNGAIVPLMGGVDLSPLALLVLLQIANLVMLSAQAWVLAWV